MLIDTFTFAGKQDFKNITEATATSIQASLIEIGYYTDALECTASIDSLKQLVHAMLPCVNIDLALTFHLTDALYDLCDTLSAYEVSDADVIDVMLSKTVLLEKMRVCTQVLEIEIELFVV